MKLSEINKKRAAARFCFLLTFSWLLFRYEGLPCPGNARNWDKPCAEVAFRRSCCIEQDSSFPARHWRDGGLFYPLKVFFLEAEPFLYSCQKFLPVIFGQAERLYIKDSETSMKIHVIH